MNIKRACIISIVLCVLITAGALYVAVDAYKGKQTSGIDGLPPQFDILVEAWNMINAEYVDKDKLDAVELSQGAVKGMIDALDDDYSAYIEPEIYDLELQNLKGKYQGIGAYVGERDEQMVIIAPMKGSPAEEAGLEPGDIILAVDGTSTDGKSVTEVALIIQGPAGTPVMLSILKNEAEEPVDVKIVRGEIKLETVVTERRENIGYIQLVGFLQTSDQDLREGLQEIIGAGVDGIVLDLRNNPGGLLNVAVNVASEFISDGVVVDVVDSEGIHSSQSARKGGVALDIPMVVLVNEGSASASEVVAGALQDYGRATIIGTQTFGKGSVQIIRTLEDGSAIHLTIARWLTPKGHPLQGVGVTPDIESELEGDELVEFAANYLNGKTSDTKVSDIS